MPCSVQEVEWGPGSSSDDRVPGRQHCGNLSGRVQGECHGASSLPPVGLAGVHGCQRGEQLTLGRAGLTVLVCMCGVCIEPRSSGRRCGHDSIMTSLPGLVHIHECSVSCACVNLNVGGAVTTTVSCDCLFESRVNEKLLLEGKSRGRINLNRNCCELNEVPVIVQIY